MDNAIVIMAAPAGEVADIASQAKACVDAGATLLRLALPAAGKDGLPDAEAAAAALAALDEATGDALTPVLPATSTALGPDAPQKFIRATRPPAVIVDVRRLMPDEGDEALKKARGFFRWLKVMEITPLFLLGKPEDVAFFVRMRAMDYIPFRRPFLLFELGAEAPGSENTADALDAFTAKLDHQPVTWAVCTHGRDEAAVIFKAVLAGGHVCTGTAFNRSLPDGREARETAALVKAAAGIISQTGRSPMSMAETRKILREAVR